MQLNPEVFRALLHRPEVVAAITQRAQDISDYANDLAEHVGRPDRPDPRYATTIQNRSDSARARARVFPQNYQAVLDDAINSTLLKAMNAYPSDPIPTAQAVPADTPWEPGLPTGAVMPEPEEIGAAADLGELGEIAGEAGAAGAIAAL